MKRLLLILMLAVASVGQTPPGGGKVAAVVGPRGDTLPTTCSIGQLWVRTGVTSPGLYGCGTTDTWSIMEAGAGSMVYPGAGVPNSTGSAWGTSYTVGTSANNLVQLNGSSQLPAVSGALLTNLPAQGDVYGTTGAGVPAANCTVGKAVYYDTTNQEWYVCGPTANTWRRVLTSDDSVAGVLTLTELGGTNYRAIGVEDSLTGDVRFNLPTAEPTAGQVWAHGAPSAGVSAGSWITPIPAADAVLTSSVQIPNGSGPTVDAAGEIAVDTTTDQLQFYGGAKRALPTIQHVSFVIPAPTVDDDINLMKAPYGMTILGIDTIIQGSTSVTGQLQECTSAGASCADLDSDIIADSDGQADDGSLTDSTIASGNWIRWKTASVSGTPTFLTVTVRFRVVVD